MKYFTWFAAIAVVFAVTFSAFAQGKPAYVGVKKCKMCHKGKKKGEQFEKWQAEPHSKAFETLKNAESAKIAKKMGIKDATTDKKCLKCHITDASIKEEGVSCEACHGPGSIYKKITIMKNREEALKVGLVIPDEKLCKKCHNPESPTYKKFVFKEKVAKVLHPIPDKKK